MNKLSHDLLTGWEFCADKVSSVHNTHVRSEVTVTWSVYHCTFLLVSCNSTTKYCKVEFCVQVLEMCLTHSAMLKFRAKFQVMRLQKTQA